MPPMRERIGKVFGWLKGKARALAGRQLTEKQLEFGPGPVSEEAGLQVRTSMHKDSTGQITSEKTYAEITGGPFPYTLRKKITKKYSPAPEMKLKEKVIEKLGKKPKVVVYNPPGRWVGKKVRPKTAIEALRDMKKQETSEDATRESNAKDKVSKGLRSFFRKGRDKP